MLVKIIQPKYPDEGEEQRVFESIVEMLGSIDEADLILLPEGSNMPAVKTVDYHRLANVNLPALIDAAKSAAKRCRALVIVNAVYPVDGDYRNRSVVYDENGNEAAIYDKAQLPPSEQPYVTHEYIAGGGLTGVYSVNGLRIGFATCYDNYFDEYSEALAVQRPDIIVSSSYQRTEAAHILRLQAAHTAHKAECWYLRSSWHKGNGLGGTSCVASPDGIIVAEATTVGVLSYDLDIKYKRTAPVNQGMKYRVDREPSIYLPAGAAITANDEKMPYPRVCAHRGCNTLAPENTMPAFGIAVAFGADEIEFDVQCTSDGVPVVMHDTTVNRTTDGEGKISNMTLAEIKALDCGVGKFEAYRGTRVPTLEEVIRRFSCHTVMNVHVYSIDNTSDEYFQKIIDIIYKYGAEKHVYIGGGKCVMEAFARLAPDLRRCSLYDFKSGEEHLEYAISCGAQKMQFFLDKWSPELIRKANEAGIKANYFFCDDTESAKKMLKYGVDTILSNEYLKIKSSL